MTRTADRPAAEGLTSADDPAAGLHTSIDELAARDFDALGAEQQAKLLGSLVRAEARIAALRLRSLASADRAKAAARSGAASTGQWAARIARADQVDVQRQVGLAQGLADRRAAEQALSSGSISAAHAAVIVQADRDLPGQVTAVQRETVEIALVEKAKVLTPSSLRRAARRAIEEVEADRAAVDEHEDDLVRAEEDRALAKVRLSLHDNDDGTVTGHFTVPTLHGQLLRKVLQAMTAPRRGRLGASQAQVGEREAQTDWARARGHAFCELLEHLPVDHLHPKTAATVVVTIAEDALREAIRVAGLDTGGALSVSEARRLACGSGILPAVLGGASLPLDLGRSARLFNESQRVALGLGHRTCAADGCERPFSWCELHHEHAWAAGGATDLKFAVPLCHFHHQRIHDRRYQSARSAAGAITFRLRT